MKIETENNKLCIHYRPNMSDLENCNPRPTVLALLVI